MTTATESKLYTADEVAAKLRLCRATVIRRIKAGAIKGFRTGGGRNPYLVRAEEFERYVKTLEAAGGES